MRCAPHTLYVVDTRLARAGPLLETLRDEGRQAARDVEVAGLTVATEIVEGNPHEKILEYVSEHDIDKAIVGSVAERVIRRSPVPVLTARGEEQD